jgi:hypothetical protein
VLNLVPRQPVPKLIPSEMRYVLILVTYLHNPQNATFFVALAGYSVRGVAEGIAGTDSEGDSSRLGE